MTYEQAVNVALAALDAERKRVAVDANLYAQGLCTTPHARFRTLRESMMSKAGGSCFIHPRACVSELSASR